MRKLVSILLTLAVMISLLVIPAVVSAASPDGVVLNGVGGGTAVWSTDVVESGSYSVLLTAANPGSASVVIPVNVPLASIDTLSYQYYSEDYFPATGDSIVGPDMILVLVDSAGQHIVGTGGAYDSSKTWWNADAVVGTNIATTSTNAGEIWWGIGGRVTFAALKVAFPSATVVGVGINFEPPLSGGSGSVYVDDITIGAVTYDLEPISAAVGLTADTVEITAISVTPGTIDFGPVTPGTPKTGTLITVENIGTVTVDVDALLNPLTGTVFNYLYLGGVPSTGYSGNWADYIISSLKPSVSKSLTTELVAPSTYSGKGSETAILVFEATA